MKLTLIALSLLTSVISAFSQLTLPTASLELYSYHIYDKYVDPHCDNCVTTTIIFNHYAVNDKGSASLEQIFDPVKAEIEEYGSRKFEDWYSTDGGNVVCLRHVYSQDGVPLATNTSPAVTMTLLPEVANYLEQRPDTSFGNGFAGDRHTRSGKGRTRVVLTGGDTNQLYRVKLSVHAYQYPYWFPGEEVNGQNTDLPYDPAVTMFHVGGSKVGPDHIVYVQCLGNSSVDVTPSLLLTAPYWYWYDIDILDVDVPINGFDVQPIAPPSVSTPQASIGTLQVSTNAQMTQLSVTNAISVGGTSAFGGASTFYSPLTISVASPTTVAQVVNSAAGATYTQYKNAGSSVGYFGFGSVPTVGAGMGVVKSDGSAFNWGIDNSTGSQYVRGNSHVVGASIAGSFIGTTNVTSPTVFCDVIYLGSGNSIGFGSGAPTHSADNGSIYMRTDGTGSSFYVRQNGSWVAK